MSDWSSDVCSSDLRSSRSKAFRLKKPCSLRGQPAKGGSPPEYRASAFGSMLSISRLSDGGELLRIEIRDRYPFHDDGRSASRLEGRGRFPIRSGAEARRVLCRAIIGGLQGSDAGVALVQQVGDGQSLGSHG